jgi:hypothetical protein
VAVAGQARRTIAIRDGRTATEVRRSVRVDADGARETVAEEYALLDRAGRLQLPTAFVAALSLRDRVRLNLEPDHVQVRPGDATPDDDRPGGDRLGDDLPGDDRPGDDLPGGDPPGGDRLGDGAAPGGGAGTGRPA